MERQKKRKLQEKFTDIGSHSFYKVNPVDINSDNKFQAEARVGALHQGGVTSAAACFSPQKTDHRASAWV